MAVNGLTETRLYVNNSQCLEIRLNVDKSDTKKEKQSCQTMNFIMNFDILISVVSHAALLGTICTRFYHNLLRPARSSQNSVLNWSSVYKTIAFCSEARTGSLSVHFPVQSTLCIRVQPITRYISSVHRLNMS